MTYVFVVDKNGAPLMPTSAYRARRLLRGEKAVIYKYKPFTIQMVDREGGETQPIEYCSDTGYLHVGVSIKSEDHEYVDEQRDLLSDEVERHNDCRKYRHTRRNRKTRHRAARFDNRKGNIAKEGFAPSLRNKRDVQIQLFKSYKEVCPITSAYFEMGQFDTQLMKAIANGDPAPQGEDYQHGERYGVETLREAVFTRDHYKCIVCGRSPFDKKGKVILHAHHVGFWKHDRTDRLSNLATVCERCHTSKNHKEGGALYGLEPKLSSMADATFMTAIRFDMFKRLKESAPDVEFHMTYGAKTKLRRKELGIRKTHANDAYAIGMFHPRHRTDFRMYKKRRRNNRVLEKFYDAKITDTRAGKTVRGAELGCNRTKRSIPRRNPENLRIYRGEKVSPGHRTIRRQRYNIQPGDILLIDGRQYMSKGVQHYGEYVTLEGHKAVKTSSAKVLYHAGGWMAVEGNDKKSVALRPAL